MKTTCTRRIQFCAGHRVVGHENLCRNLHGHNWVAYITASAFELDSVGRVIDFSVIKQKYGDWIDANWDHGMILWISDPWLEILGTADKDHRHRQKLYSTAVNPTSENLARILFDLQDELMVGTGVYIDKIVLFETENCSSEVTR